MKNTATNRELIGFNDLPMMLIGIPILGVLIPFMFYDRSISDPWLHQFLGTIISLGYTLLYWSICRAIKIKSHRLYPSIELEPRRILVQFCIIVLSVSIVSAVMSLSLKHFLIKQFEPNILQLLKDVGVALFVAALVITCYEAVYFFQRYKRSVVDAELLQQEMMRSQLSALKSQVNPHFLFNSLNTLVNVIPEDADLAVDLVRKLSKVYRYILEIRDRELITLKEELEFLNAYIFLQKARFGKNLKVNIEIDEGLLKMQIVPLSLQMLMENAIKHNVVSTEKPLVVSIKMENGNKLVIKNNLQLKQQVMDSTGTGLENISNRYKFIANKEVTQIVTTNSFIVTLPLLQP